MDRSSKRNRPVVQKQGPAGGTAATAPPAERSSRRITAAAAAILVLLTIIVFAQTARFEFVNYDDNAYVLAHKPVLGGLTSPGAVTWAFTAMEVNNWHPLTWLSHMLDVQCYGVEWPGGHHLTNVAIHAAASVLLLFLIRDMTGRIWPAASWRRYLPSIRFGWSRWRG